jgi:two-component system alkaline phosphatase synthesis response regulator PhoP
MTEKRILLIDDNDDLGFLVSTCLEEFGSWKVSIANGAETGLNLAKREKPDIILLDVMMPEMNGITLFGLLQSEPKTQAIPVIFMTAKVQNSDLELYHSLGVKGVITKPFDPLTLVEQITEMLH